MAIKLVNVSCPAAFGVEWVNGDSGNRYQLMNLRSTTHLMFGVRLADRAEWMTSSVIAPERFGMDSPPKSFRAFEVIARRYVED